MCSIIYEWQPGGMVGLRPEKKTIHIIFLRSLFGFKCTNHGWLDASPHTHLFSRTALDTSTTCCRLRICSPTHVPHSPTTVYGCECKTNEHYYYLLFIFIYMYLFSCCRRFFLFHFWKGRRDYPQKTQQALPLLLRCLLSSFGTLATVIAMVVVAMAAFHFEWCALFCADIARVSLLV